MMNHAEGIHQIESLCREDVRKLFGVAHVYGDTVAESIHLNAPARDVCGRVRQFDRCDSGSGAREVDRIGADAAPDLEHALAGPPGELGETGDVRFDEILALLDLIEVLARADRFRRVPDIAGPHVPIRADRVDRDIGERLVNVHDGSLSRPTTA
jgi:hypothetical protein